MPLLILGAALVAFSTGLLVLKALLASRLRNLAVDRPNERSLHQTVVPRTGGLSVLLAVTAGIWLATSRDTLTIWAATLTLGAVSFLDDRRGLPVWTRFAAQFAAALVVVLAVDVGGSSPWPFVSILAIVWMTNLYNFMDGSDGLAGGMGLTGFTAYAVAAALQGSVDLAVLCVCLAAGCASFLTRNLPPASIFMGDAGSTTLGFCAASLGLYGVSRDLWSLWFPALVFLPFSLDATVTLMRRALRRDKVWQAHREHYYQRMIRSGWTHAGMGRVAHSIMLGTAVTALLLVQEHPLGGWLALAGWCLVLAALMVIADARWARHRSVTETRAAG